MSNAGIRIRTLSRDFDGEASVLLFRGNAEREEYRRSRRTDQRGARASPAASCRPDLKLDLIADQPSVVHERIQDLEREFLLAIGSVIVVNDHSAPDSRRRDRRKTAHFR